MRNVLNQSWWAGWIAVVAVCCLPLATIGAAEPTADDLEFFEKQVRPILVQNCFKCHGDEKQKGGLRLDSRDAALKGGDTGPAVEPGKASESLLVEVIQYTGEYKMPPKGKLPQEQIAVLTDWVKRGAPWPAEKRTATADPKAPFDLEARRAKHWSFQPLLAAQPPRVKNELWVRSPIDRFILSKLESSGIAPAPAADKRVLLRRVTYDLIGLPPSPADIDAFLADDSPRAFENVVNRLLDSPHYGERWARHWLDLVRYAETSGHEFDFEMPLAYEYRDYVIRALNADVPYSQFVMEQVAGDLLPQPRLHPTERFNESIIGTGFFFLGESLHSPVDIRGDESTRVDNQIDVFAKTFLGLTVGCARCHDHKFDAISTKDYYALAGFMQSSRYQTACVDPPEKNREIAGELERLRNEQVRLLREMATAELNVATPRKQADPPDFRVFEDFARDGYSDWYVTGEAFGKGPLRPPYHVLGPDTGSNLGNVLGAGVAHSGGLSRVLQGVIRSQTFEIEKPYILYHLAGNETQVNLIIDGFQKIRAPIYGGLTIRLTNADKLKWYAQEVGKWMGHRAYIEILDEGAGYAACDKVVFSARSDPPPDAPNPVQAALLPGTQSCDLADQKAKSAEFAALAQKQKELETGIRYSRKVMAMTDGTSEDEHVFLRGNYKKLGEVVPRRFLEGLAGSQQPPLTQGSGRLELARRLVDPSNPLLPRVIVNRVWKQHFGEGIVRTPDDFGNMGQPPTHPELLDYLAAEFVKNGWSLKWLHRKLLLSSTYLMSSRPDDPRAEEADPQNKLWHRMPLRRLEAEIIRDAMLAVSGRLNDRVYGPSVLPHLSSFMEGRGRPGNSGPLDGDGRRSIYINVRRNFLTPMFLAFDYPTPFTTIGRRSVSNVPAQALAMMNNPFIIQQADLWAKKAIAEHTEPRARITAMYVAAFGRPPDDGELQAALAFVGQTASGISNDPLTWGALAHVLLNVKEFIFIN